MEEELRTLIEMNHDGMIILDRDYIIEYANRSAVELTGLQVNELVGRNIESLFGGEIARVIAEVSAGDSVDDAFHSDFYMEILTARGDKIEMGVCLATTIGKEGIKRTHVCLRDISERKRSEERLKSTEEKYRLLFERVQQGLFISTREGKFIDCNQAMLDMLGYESKEDFLSLDITRDVYANPDDRKTFQELVEENGVVKDFDVEFRKKDGQKVTILLAGSIVRDLDGNIIGYEGINTDITEIKNIEHDLRQTNDFLRNLIESSVDGIIAADIKGNILIFNKGAEKLLGYNAQEVIGKLHITEIYPPGGAGEIMRMLRTTQFGGIGKLETTQSTLVNKDGEHIPINISAALVYEDGIEIASVGIFTDLREKLKMERELQDAQFQLLQSEKMSSLGKLAAGVAHEINNPLGGILIYSNLLLEDMDEDDLKREDLRRIASEATRCKDIVKSLLEFARQTEPKMDSIDINRSINDGLYFLENQATFHNIEIVKELNPTLPLVHGNSSQLKQVFMNMMVNAAEAMDGLGVLTVTTSLSADDLSVLVEFSDTGKGIPPEDMSRIFDPFFTTKEVGKGTGLGLSLSYGVIEAHKGKIDLKSKVGEGTSFIIQLPVAFEDSGLENNK